MRKKKLVANPGHENLLMFVVLWLRKAAGVETERNDEAVARLGASFGTYGLACVRGILDMAITLCGGAEILLAALPETVTQWKLSEVFHLIRSMQVRRPLSDTDKRVVFAACTRFYVSSLHSAIMLALLEAQKAADECVAKPGQRKKLEKLKQLQRQMIGEYALFGRIMTPAQRKHYRPGAIDSLPCDFALELGQSGHGLQPQMPTVLVRKAPKPDPRPRPAAAGNRPVKADRPRSLSHNDIALYIDQMINVGNWPAAEKRARKLGYELSPDQKDRVMRQKHRHLIRM